MNYNDNRPCRQCQNMVKSKPQRCSLTKRACQVERNDARPTACGPDGKHFEDKTVYAGEL